MGPGESFEPVTPAIVLTIATGIRDGRDRENVKLTRLDMITICDRDRIIVLVQRLLI